MQNSICSDECVSVSVHLTSHSCQHISTLSIRMQCTDAGDGMVQSSKSHDDITQAAVMQQLAKTKNRHSGCAACSPSSGFAVGRSNYMAWLRSTLLHRPEPFRSKIHDCRPSRRLTKSYRGAAAVYRNPATCPCSLNFKLELGSSTLSSGPNSALKTPQAA